MKTPEFDELINMYKLYQSKAYLTKKEKKQFNEFLKIKDFLIEYDFIKSFCDSCDKKK
jgi:hypothetical protein